MSISIADVDDRARHEKPAVPQPAVRMLSAFKGRAVARPFPIDLRRTRTARPGARAALSRHAASEREPRPHDEAARRSDHS